MNVADTERAATGLRKAGYDLAVLGYGGCGFAYTCSFARAARKVFRRIGEIPTLRKRSARETVDCVMGCVAQLKDSQSFKVHPRSTRHRNHATDRIAR